MILFHSDLKGYVDGVFYYSYSDGYFKFSFPSLVYEELAEFNINVPSLLTFPFLFLIIQKGVNDFLNQWLYKTGDICGCETRF